jgi:hypothetical protein
LIWKPDKGRRGRAIQGKEGMARAIKGIWEKQGVTTPITKSKDPVRKA